jgi:hypothetical protein
MDIIGPRDVDLVHTRTAPAPTELQYGALQRAYDHFNNALFAGRLPSCMITLQRQARTLGYFSPRKFIALQGDARTDEIALNPAHFHQRTPLETCSTLVHEMMHLAQEHFGKPAKGRYHNKECAAGMKAIGLHPSSTGEPGGAETGDHMSHYIIPGGPFALAYEAFERTGATIVWGDALRMTDDKPAKLPKRVKFSCPRCSFNVQAVPSATGKVACISCGNLEMVAA